MVLDVELRQQSRCRFSFRKTQFDLVDATAEACVFGHDLLRKHSVSLFVLILNTAHVGELPYECVTDLHR